MATAVTLQPVPVTHQPASQPSSQMGDVMLSMVLVSMYGARMSKKALRKMKRQLFWTSVKLKAKSLFKKDAVSDRTLIYILIGIALIALIVLAPVAALILAILALILILAGVI